MTTCTFIGTGCGCTKKAIEGRSYCEEHLFVVYKEGSSRARRKKEERTVDKVRLIESLFNEAIEQLEAEGFDCYGDSELKSKSFELEDASTVE